MQSQSSTPEYNKQSVHWYQVWLCVLKCQESKKSINFGLIRIPDMTQWSCCLQVCFLKRNNRKALYIMTPFTINPLAFIKCGWVCQKLEDASSQIWTWSKQDVPTQHSHHPWKPSNSLITFVLLWTAKGQTTTSR